MGNPNNNTTYQGTGMPFRPCFLYATQLNMKMFFYIATAIILFACKTTQTTHMTANDRDKHGCLPSAGYVWSDVRKDCIRTFEVGVPLYKFQNPYTSLAAYIVFSSNSTYAEAYIPGIEGNIIMQQKETDIWKGHGYTLVQTDKTKYILYKKQQIIYSNHQQL